MPVLIAAYRDGATLSRELPATTANCLKMAMELAIFPDPLPASGASRCYPLAAGALANLPAPRACLATAMANPGMRSTELSHENYDSKLILITMRHVPIIE